MYQVQGGVLKTVIMISNVADHQASIHNETVTLRGSDIRVAPLIEVVRVLRRHEGYPPMAQIDEVIHSCSDPFGVVYSNRAETGRNVVLV